MSPRSDEVEDLLRAWSLGDQAALEKLFPLVYRELELVAHSYLSREAPGHELEAPDLISEVFISLIERPKIEWQSRMHFFALSARIMRQILVEHARKNLSSKRGGDPKHVSLSEAAVLPITENNMAALLDLDEALGKLAKLDKRKTEVVELRYFAGLTPEETAKVLNIAPVTVEREWRLARSWLGGALVGVNRSTQSDVRTTTKKPKIASSLTVERERKLAEAWANRELIATLMSENWAGLKLLVQLRRRPNVTKPELVLKSGVDAELVNSLLLKLHAFGVLEDQKDICALNEHGYTLLKNFEKATGSSFD